MSQKEIINYDVVYGIHPVFELLKNKKRKVFEIFILKADLKLHRDIKSLLPSYPVTVHLVEKELLNRKAGCDDHQSIVAFAQPFPFLNKFFDAKKSPFLLLLDGVCDVRNLGAIIRSAYCTGVDGIIISRKAGAPLSATALKASAGLAERIDIFQVASVSQALILLKTAGYSIYATTPNSKESVFDIKYNFPLCVVIGSEGFGVSSEVMKSSTAVTLPQKTKDISYNASVAAGIVLFLISQKR